MRGGRPRWGAAVQKQSRQRLLANSSTARSIRTSRRWSVNFGEGAESHEVPPQYADLAEEYEDDDSSDDDQAYPDLRKSG